MTTVERFFAADVDLVVLDPVARLPGFLIGCGATTALIKKCGFGAALDRLNDFLFRFFRSFSEHGKEKEENKNVIQRFGN